MINIFKHKYQLYLISLLITIIAAALVATIIFLNESNTKVKEERNRVIIMLNAQMIAFKTQVLLEQTKEAMKLQRFKQLQQFFTSEGLLALQIRDAKGRIIFFRSAVSLPISIRKLFSVEKLKKLHIKKDVVLVSKVALPLKGTRFVFVGRKISYNRFYKPSYYLFFVYKDTTPPIMDSFEQLAMLFEVIVGIALIALLWFYLRKSIKPYENFLKEVKKASPNRVESQLPIQDEISFLIGSFKGIIKDLREKEKELEQMHKRALLRAKEREKFTQDVLTAIPLGIITFNRRGIFLECNHVIESLLGLKKFVFKNLHYRQIFKEGQKLISTIDLFFETQSPQNENQVEFKRKDGQSKILNISVTPLTDPQGVFYGVTVVLQDETERAELENNLKIQQNLAALGEMAAGIAHEFKNSLSTISGYAQMILGNARPGAEYKRAHALVGEVESLAHIISDFLEFARPIPIEKTKINLDFLLEEITTEFKEKYPSIHFEFNTVPATIIGEEHLLKKAFNNLILNAVQSFDNLTRKEDRKIKITLEFATDRKILIRIEDNGCGMDNKTLSHLFTPFFTTRSDGVGMGMAVVQKVISLHGGLIDIQSSPGRGTIVTLTLVSSQFD